MRTAQKALRIRERGSRAPSSTRPVPSISGLSCAAFALQMFLFMLCSLIPAPESCATDLDAIVGGFQRRYASAETAMGAFQQNYRAPGINQVESGIFRMKRPCLMRWEYRRPEEKLFIADGREAFLYAPLDRQVTIQPFSPNDMRGTPLEFLLGGADIKKSFTVSWESHLKPTSAQTILIRLSPRAVEGSTSF